MMMIMNRLMCFHVHTLGLKGQMSLISFFPPNNHWFLLQNQGALVNNL